MRAMILCICVVAALVVIPSGPAQGDEEATAHEYCGTNIPPDEAIGFVPLPEGDVFCPLIADPKAAYSYVSYVRGTSSSPLGTDLGSVGVPTGSVSSLGWTAPRRG